MAAEEATPLLKHDDPTKELGFSPGPNRVLLGGFIVSAALSFTQVPILYVFRLMECESFYHDHEFTGDGDRCNRSDIDAATAKQVSILGASTMLCSILNLFVAGWQIKKWGPRRAMLVQTAAPAIRVAVQALGVAIGARRGVITVQLSQIVGLFGGQAGYILVLNTAAGEVALPEKRTALFGMLQGAIMLGMSIGNLLGGRVGDTLGIQRPFEVAAVLFALSSLLSAVFVPYIDPKTLSRRGTKPTGLRGLVQGLQVLCPRRLRRADGRNITDSGITFLALGVFMGVLATGYAPYLIQMYATAAFHFIPTANGYLMAANSFIRGIFLIFVFPRIIHFGRQHASSRPAKLLDEPTSYAASADLDHTIRIPASRERGDQIAAESSTGREFDLLFLRWSLVADGMVTAYTASATKDWHIYLAGFLLPLASGSAPASKGVITEMCKPDERSDALQAMTLIENLAMLSTLGLFGFIFSAFSEEGKAYLTFYWNAAVALVAVVVLMFSRFPPADAVPVCEEQEE